MHQYRHADKLKCERGVLLFFPRFDYYHLFGTRYHVLNEEVTFGDNNKFPNKNCLVNPKRC